MITRRKLLSRSILLGLAPALPKLLELPTGTAPESMINIVDGKGVVNTPNNTGLFNGSNWVAGAWNRALSCDEAKAEMNKARKIYLPEDA